MIRSLKFSDFQTKTFLRQIKNLREHHSLVADTPPELENFVRGNFLELVGFLTCLSKRTCFEGPFKRIVINKRVNPTNENLRLKYYSQIKYPPASVLEKITYSRANLPKQSVFYAASGKLIATLETNPEVGDLCTHTIWMQKENTEISYLPIFHKEEIINHTTEFADDWEEYLSILEDLDKNVSLVLRELYEFIATVFTTSVNPNNRIEYLYSAVISDIFMNDPKYKIDAIYYPSVPGNFAASNIALKPSVLESFFYIQEITESICTMSNNKKWMSYRTGNATEVEKGVGLIKWQNVDYMEDWVHGLLQDYDVKL